MTKEELMGRKVHVKNENHPHYNEVGTIVGFDILKIINKPAVRVKGDNNEFYIQPTDVKLL
jgi:hypothetical protein